MLGYSQRALRKDPAVSADTNSESHQLEAQLGATKLIRIRRIVGHPSRLASRPPVRKENEKGKGYIAVPA
eukprot:1157661-Pelagomonas_calceolata.AAC.9